MSLNFTFIIFLTPNSMSSIQKNFFLYRNGLNVVYDIRWFVKIFKMGTKFPQGNHIWFSSVLQVRIFLHNFLGSRLDSCKIWILSFYLYNNFLLLLIRDLPIYLVLFYGLIGTMLDGFPNNLTQFIISRVIY